MPAINGVDQDVPKHIVDQIKETFSFRDDNVYNKKTGRQLKKYGSDIYNGFGLWFKLNGRVINYDWARKNLK